MGIWNKIFGSPKASENKPSDAEVNTPCDAELFLLHLQSIFGEQDSIHISDASDGGPRVCVFVYRDIPEPGMITGVTYGLSLCPFPAWKFSRPEIIVSVNSDTSDWPFAAATFVAGARGEKAFQYGDVFSTDVPLASDTKMDAFLVFAQSILDPEFQEVQLSNYKVHLSQFYPIYRQEIPIYERIGLEAFWKHKDFHRFDVDRPPISE